MNFLVALGGLAVLLLTGLVIHSKVALFRHLMLPVSLLGGLVGLVGGPYVLDVVPPNVVELWSRFPGVLINFVFAALFLGVRLPSPATLVRLGGPIFRFGVVTSMGQYFVPMLLTGLVLIPLFGSHALISCIVEVGFAGGHGTAAAMTPVFDELGFEAGGALGQMSATVGIVVGVMVGMALVNRGVAAGRASQVDSTGVLESGQAASHRDAFVPTSERVPVALGTVRSDVLDPLTLHVAVLSVAVLLGWVIWQALRALHPTLAGLPLFPFAMIGGMLVQWLAGRMEVDHHLDRQSVQRLMGVSLDLLVVAAIASLRLDLFFANAVPFLLLMIAGTMWTIGAFVYLAPRMMKNDWFEQGVVMFGTQTAVTAVGLMLLRVVDPENRTTAAQAFAARAVVASPLIGGGLVTATLPLLVMEFGLWPVFAGTALVAVVALVWPSREVEVAEPI